MKRLLIKAIGAMLSRCPLAERGYGRAFNLLHLTAR